MHKQYDIKVQGTADVSGFITKLVLNGTKISSLSVQDGTARFRTNRKGLLSIRRYRRSYRVKVTVRLAGTERGFKGVFTSYRFLIACLIPFAASFFLWNIDVDSEMPEVAERIEKRLEKDSIVLLRPLFLIPDEGEIRQNLMLEDPTLSWVRFRRVGTSLTIIPMLSPSSDEAIVEEGPPSDLVARTGGVITRFALKKGERVGHVHQTVKKGDVLATGILEQGDKTTIVGADGAVYADYWVEYSFSLPKTIDFRLQGEEKVDFSFQLPWKNQGSAEEDTPFWAFIRTDRHVEEKAGQLELAEGMEETVLIPLLKNRLMSESFSKSVVKDEKILHVSFDNDKVNGTILFLINDNIAVKRPISQGD